MKSVRLSAGPPLRLVQALSGDLRAFRSLRSVDGAILDEALSRDLGNHFAVMPDPEHAVVCDRSARCTVNVLWVRVRDAVTGALDGMTLADLIPATPSAEPPGTLPTTTNLTGAMTAS